MAHDNRESHREAGRRSCEHIPRVLTGKPSIFNSAGTPKTMSRQEAHSLAAHKARYTHKPWIAWVDANGIGHAERETRDSVKAAMLAVGTSGRWTAYSGTKAFVQRWPLGVLRLRNIKHDTH